MKVELSDLRDRLTDAALAKPAAGEVWLNIDSFVVKIVFCGVTPLDTMLKTLSFITSEPKERFDELVYVMEDGSEETDGGFVGTQEEKSCYQDEEVSYYHYGGGRGFTLRFTKEKTTFICVTPNEYAAFYWHNKPFINEISWWFRERCLLLHGAAVGFEGKGAFITAPSGYGKSTLALSCLSEGLQYVAEDYILIPRSGPVLAHSIYSTGNLSRNSLEMLPEFKKHVLAFDEKRQKYLVDLSDYRSRFTTSLPVRCMIFPMLTDNPEPFIEKSSSAAPFMEALASTVKQIKYCHNFQRSMLDMFERLKQLPAYQIHLTRDPHKNVQALKRFFF